MNNSKQAEIFYYVMLINFFRLLNLLQMTNLGIRHIIFILI